MTRNKIQRLRKKKETYTDTQRGTEGTIDMGQEKERNNVLKDQRPKGYDKVYAEHY